jgi:FtsH-binding integral membrane protein
MSTSQDNNINKNNDITEKNKWESKDFVLVILCLLITIIFSLRHGSPDYILKELLKQLWAYSIYSIATVLIIIGLTKKMFKYNPTMKQIIRWAFMLGAFCAVSQFFHELFKYFTGK